MAAAAIGTDSNPPAGHGERAAAPGMPTGLIAELERREAQAFAAAAASDAKRWKAEAQAEQRSRKATEEAAKQRAHAAIAETARWRAEAEAADSARRAAEGVARLSPPLDGGLYVPALCGSPLPTHASAPPAPSAGAASAEAVAHRVMEQINAAAEQLSFAEARARAAGLSPTPAEPAQPHAGAGAEGGGSGMGGFSCCGGFASPAMLNSPGVRQPHTGGFPSVVSEVASPSPGVGGVSGGARPPSGGKLDAELARIDDEIEHLQNALASATRVTDAGAGEGVAAS